MTFWKNNVSEFSSIFPENLVIGNYHNCVSCAFWCVYMGQVPEIKLMMQSHMTSIWTYEIERFPYWFYVECTRGTSMTFAMYNQDVRQQCTATMNNWIISETFFSLFNFSPPGQYSEKFRQNFSWNIFLQIFLKNSSGNFLTNNRTRRTVLLVCTMFRKHRWLLLACMRAWHWQRQVVNWICWQRCWSCSKKRDTVFCSSHRSVLMFSTPASFMFWFWHCS